jgi:plasmid stabilization system protein ParE
MARYVLTDSAKADLRRINAHLREASPMAAQRVRGEFRAAMRRLADFPSIGHRREDLTPLPVRFWAVYSYLIIYRPDQKPLQVVRVLHAARDVSALLREK